MYRRSSHSSASYPYVRSLHNTPQQSHGYTIFVFLAKGRIRCQLHWSHRLGWSVCHVFYGNPSGPAGTANREVRFYPTQTDTMGPVRMTLVTALPHKTELISSMDHTWTTTISPTKLFVGLNMDGLACRFLRYMTFPNRR